MRKDFDSIKTLLVNAKKTLTLKEASALTKMSASTLYKLTSSREIPYYKPVGKMVYFDRDVLEAWIRRYRFASRHEIDAEAQEILHNLAAKKPALSYV